MTNLSKEQANRQVEIAFGRNREDKNFKTTTGSFGDMVETFTVFREGDKDGPCCLQGGLVSGANGGQRIAKAVTRNHLMMFDHDTGETLDEIEAKIRGAGLFAILWTTYNHMTPETLIAEDQLFKWIKANGQDVASNGVSVEQAIEYLIKTKNVKPDVFAGDVSIERVHTLTGMKFRLRHAPMSRVRSLFLLDAPFDFANRGINQSAAILEWKERYAGLATQLGLTWDKTCVDPSRLMYLPRCAPGERDKHEIRVIPGADLDINKVPRVQTERPRHDRAPDDLNTDQLKALLLGDDEAAEEAEEAASPFKTKGLYRFLKHHSHDFQAADWLQDQDPDGVRHDHGDKLEFECPNEEQHTDQKMGDRAFMVQNASDSEGGFFMYCHHNGCQEASGKDRGWYLDTACQKYGIDDASQLLSYCTSVEAEEIKDQEHEDALKKVIAELKPDVDAAKLDVILTELAKRKGGAEVQVMLKDIAKKIDWSRADVDKAFAAAKKEVKENEPKNPSSGDRAGPPKDLTKASVIWSHWTVTDKCRTVSARFIAENTENPIVFQRKADNSIVRIREGSSRITFEEMDYGRWRWELSATGHMQFKRLDANGLEEPVEAFECCINHMYYGRIDGIPILDNIITVPVFAPDGSLMFEKGYCPALQHYINPNLVVRPVPDVITAADVEEAINWLAEAIIDFPFSDTFDGSDTLPQYTDELDEDGWHLPNLDRGRSSRANFIALLLQPFARGMIDGPCPAYHIDKSAPGTGAGYLVNVLSMIIEGQTAPASPKAENEEEFRKAITAVLYEGRPIVFLDNINHKVDSGHLAAALTTSVWRDRKLGSTETVEVPNTATWILAGNNLQFSHELMRRNVPIRIDAKVPNPAQDRTADSFKHELTAWLREHRSDLVWACHVLICNWIDKGCPKGSKRIQSFDEWSNVMSGIMETAGITGFLDNVKTYIADRDDDRGGIDDMMSHLLRTFGQEPTTLKEMYDACTSGVEAGLSSHGQFQFEVPIHGTDDHGRMISFGRLIKKHVIGATFRSDDGNFYTFRQFTKKHPAKYQFLWTHAADGTEI